MSTHTPGPWQAIRTNPHDGYDGFEIRAQPGPVLRGFTRTVADVYGLGSNEEHQANARLIAAAPDLLAMLKVAQLWLDVDGRFDMQGINAAIAKAEGRP
jgi:hypothetical protein